MNKVWILLPTFHVVIQTHSDSFIMRMCSQVTTQMLIMPNVRQSGRLTLFLSRSTVSSSPSSSLKLLSPVLFVFTIFICPANLSLVAKCHPGPGCWREWSVRRLRSDGESTETITLYSPQCFPCHGWSRTLADLVKGFICYSEEQILQKQTRKRTVYHSQLYSAIIVSV